MDLELSLPIKNVNAYSVKTAQDLRQFVFLYHEPRYEDFYHNFLTRNLPCILSCGITDKWDACKDWVTSRGEPTLQDVCKHFGKFICLWIFF